MHEESLVRALLRQVDELRRQHAAMAVSEVSVEIGALSGVEPLLVASAFERLAPQLLNPDCRLRMAEVSLQVDCHDCRRRFEPERFQFRCPTCGSGRTQVVAGEEFRLVSLELALPPEGDQDSVTAAAHPAARSIPSTAAL